MTTGILRPYTRIIGAGETDDVETTGDYVRVQDAEGGTVTVETPSGDRVTLLESEGVRFTSSFSVLKVTNEAGVKRRVVLLVGVGDFSSQRFSGLVTPKPAGTIQAVGTFAGGETIPANADRRQLVMRFDINNAQNLSIAGLPFGGGDAFELDITGAVDVTGDAGDLVHVAEVI